jgi:lipoic acid synthetase
MPNNQQPGKLRKPPWLKIRLKSNPELAAVRQLIQQQGLHTVCESAHCPNLNDCWSRKTATFMILGEVCTRNCRFCAVGWGKPMPLDAAEPHRIAAAVQAMGLRYVVLTSVTRDDLLDGGAQHWAATIRAIRELNPDSLIEVLIPDFQGDIDALNTLFTAFPEVIGHNLETVPELYSRARPQANYHRSLEILRRAKEAGFVTKTGIMIGLGETAEQVQTLIRDAVAVGCDILTIGQYLQPTPAHLPVARYIGQAEFTAYQQYGLAAGLKHVYAGPLVRSSFHAAEVFAHQNLAGLKDVSR